MRRAGGGQNTRDNMALLNSFQLVYGEDYRVERSGCKLGPLLLSTTDMKLLKGIELASFCGPLIDAPDIPGLKLFVAALLGLVRSRAGCQAGTRV